MLFQSIYGIDNELTCKWQRLIRFPGSSGSYNFTYWYYLRVLTKKKK